MEKLNKLIIDGSPAVSYTEAYLQSISHIKAAILKTRTIERKIFPGTDTF